MALLDRIRAKADRRGDGPASPPGPWVLLAAWGPCGFSPAAPGTIGTLGAIPLAWALSKAPTWALPLAIVLLGALGLVAAGRAGRYWGETDAPGIVVDEVVGYLVTMALVPFTWRTALIGFALFRVFDIAKPWPVSAFDRWKSPAGVMLDDVAAGVYAMACLVAAVRWLPGAL